MILNNNFEFYRKLSKPNKYVFGKRLLRFLKDKNFESRENLQITLQMKLYIAATAIQISFGLKEYMLSTFHTIILYPGEFYSKFSKALTKAETNGTGVIVFSCKDLLYGFSKDNDALNLAYHELAHATFIDHFKNRYDEDLA
ncbi:MAG: zinc-dependent peptidase [Bacteroidales bacterium]|nr:zinc-dependent peptidase [Bacteroidales bacterium]MCF8403599.1 zinc-dependent peptidase [Bacteroidales bacterium]